MDPPIAVFHTEGAFYAIDDTCTHDTYSLADGYVDGCEVECALHFARYDLQTGAAPCQLANGGVRTYPCEVEDDDIFVDISSRG
ncbi:MAG: non-heme iron oxygenase ferredoxin subunit [Actinomycetota bacterium]|nr:non-heme iron oxygenase ferredoxin subunit [Actinomycetota bacterium]